MRREYLYFLFGMLIADYGCRKTSSPENSAALNIVNAINNSNPIVTNFTEFNAKGILETSLQFYSTANQIPFASSWESGSYVGKTGLSIAQISDTTTTIWNGHFNLSVGSIQSLFLFGDTSSVDTLFSVDAIPFYPFSDSVAGVRFVNLVRNSQPMSINIQENPPSQTEFTDLDYKRLSSFKAYSANSAVPGYYNFEIRDQATDSLLQSFQWAFVLEKCNTIVIAGSSANGIVVFETNNY
jgi:hypothetical protein